MATEVKPTGTNSLAEFEFDDNNEFFGQKVKSDDTDIKEVKSNGKLDGKKEEATSIKETKTDQDDIVDEDDVTFFEEPKKATTKKEEIEEEEDEVVVEEKTKPTKTTTKKEEKEDEDEDATTKKEPKKTTKKEEEPEDESKFFTTLAAELKEKGILSTVALPKDKDITEDEFFELHDKEIEARVTEAFEGFFKELDPDAIDFLKFKRSGGKTHEFFAAYTDTLDIDEFDDTNKAQIEKVIRHYISTVEDLDGEDLEDRIKYINESGLAKVKAGKWFDKIKAAEKQEKEELTKQVELQAKQREQAAKEFADAFLEVATSTEEVGGFTFTKAEQKELASYVTKPTVKIGKNKFIPEFNKKLGAILKAEKPEDKQKLLVLAKLLKTDFDTSGITIKEKTKVAREAKSKLREAKTGGKSLHSSGVNNRGERSLADFFPDSSSS